MKLGSSFLQPSIGVPLPSVCGRKQVCWLEKHSRDCEEFSSAHGRERSPCSGLEKECGDPEDPSFFQPTAQVLFCAWRLGGLLQRSAEIKAGSQRSELHFCSRLLYAQKEAACPLLAGSSFAPSMQSMPPSMPNNCKLEESGLLSLSEVVMRVSRLMTASLNDQDSSPNCVGKNYLYVLLISENILERRFNNRISLFL